jgi:hypothetical protein
VVDDDDLEKCNGGLVIYDGDVECIVCVFLAVMVEIEVDGGDDLCLIW